MKKGLIIFGVLILVLAGWYLLSPIFIDVELDEASPLLGEFEGSVEVKNVGNEQLEETDEIVKEMEDSMPKGVEIISEGEFMEGAHEVEGKVILIDDSGKKILRFEDFETINGPNLHIYLSSDLGAGDFIDLGEIKATKGNVNYELPEGVDLEKYDKVLVWCVPFKVLFSYAEF